MFASTTGKFTYTWKDVAACLSYVYLNHGDFWNEFANKMVTCLLNESIGSKYRLRPRWESAKVDQLVAMGR